MGQPPPPQMMSQPLPMPGQGMPPYLASRTAARVGAPVEPFKDGIRTVLIVFGVLLLAAFAVPMATEPSMAFRWDMISALDALGKFDHIYLAAAGVLALVFAMVPLGTVPRGWLTAILGITPLIIALIQVLKVPDSFDWTIPVKLLGALTLVAGLLLRHEYRSQTLPRLLTTIGALCVILPWLIPDVDGDLAIKGAFDLISNAPGKAKLPAILRLLPLVLAVFALLCWIPAPSSAGAKVIAWLFILSGVITAYTNLLVAGHLADAVKLAPNPTLVGPWVGAAWAGFIGYGLATVFGKSLEQA